MTVYIIYAINIGQHVFICRTITGLRIGICVCDLQELEAQNVNIHVGVWMLLIKENIYACPNCIIYCNTYCNIMCV